MRRVALALLVVSALAACDGSNGDDKPVAQDGHPRRAASSDTQDVQPVAPWLLDGQGDSGDAHWQLYWAKASDNGVCQAVAFSRGTTTTTVEQEAAKLLGLLDGREDSCVPQPATSSVNVDPIQLTWGSKTARGLARAYLAGVAAPGLSDVRVVTATRRYEAPLTPHGGFLVTVAEPPQRVSFVARGKSYSCGIDWLDGDPVDRCDGLMP